MIAIVIPVHNEQAHLAACLRTLWHAAASPFLDGEEVLIVTVLDACTDDSVHIGRRHGVVCLSINSRCVGEARALGAQYAITQGARWLAFTDADSLVAPDWLAMQLGLGSEVVCGTVEIADWATFPPQVRHEYLQAYQDADGHRHVHGANLGMSAKAYISAGGFSSLSAHEDVALVASLVDCGYAIAWSARPRVRTSPRLLGRTPEGFAGYLRLLVQRSQGLLINAGPPGDSTVAPAP